MSTPMQTPPGEWNDSERRIFAAPGKCHYCGYDLKGVALSSTSVCPECGTATEPFRVGRVCSSCHYALDGIELNALTKCPECGSAFKADEYWRLWSPGARRFWWAFRLTPLATLVGSAAADYFGDVPMALVFPFSTCLLCTVFAEGAETQDDIAAGRRSRRAPIWGRAAIAALQWTVASGIIIVVLALVVGVFVLLWR